MIPGQSMETKVRNVIILAWEEIRVKKKSIQNGDNCKQ